MRYNLDRYTSIYRGQLLSSRDQPGASEDRLDTLKDMYQGVSDACIDRYLMKLLSLRMEGNENLMTYINRLMELENQLANIRHSLIKIEKKKRTTARTTE